MWPGMNSPKIDKFYIAGEILETNITGRHLDRAHNLLVKIDGIKKPFGINSHIVPLQSIGSKVKTYLYFFKERKLEPAIEGNNEDLTFFHGPTTIGVSIRNITAKVIEILESPNENYVIMAAKGLFVHAIDEAKIVKKGDFVKMQYAMTMIKNTQQDKEIKWSNDVTFLKCEHNSMRPGDAFVKTPRLSQPFRLYPLPYTRLEPNTKAKIIIVSASPKNLTLIKNNKVKKSVFLGGYEEHLDVDLKEKRIGIKKAFGMVTKVISNFCKGNLIVVDCEELIILALDKNSKKAKIGDYVKIQDSSMEIWRVYLTPNQIEKLPVKDLMLGIIQENVKGNN